MHRPVLALVAVACLVAAAVWGRSTRYLRKLELRVEAEFGSDNDATRLARAGLVHGEARALATADRLFTSPIAPWCAEVF